MILQGSLRESAGGRKGIKEVTAPEVERSIGVIGQEARKGQGNGQVQEAETSHATDPVQGVKRGQHTQG